MLLVALLFGAALVHGAPRVHRQATAVDSCGDFQWTCYHSAHSLERMLQSLTEKHPQRTKMYSIGKSVRGADLWVLAIAAADADRHVFLRPELKYTANMHGDETVGRELLLRFAQWLLDNFDANEDIQKLLKSNRVHIMPTLNPDGYARTIQESASPESCFQGTQPTRRNANGIDLNRNFPQPDGAPGEGELQPETLAVMRWDQQEPFILDGNFHGGAVVVNYPYDDFYFTNINAAIESRADDNDVFRAISLAYAKRMSGSPRCKDGGTFKDGITNGAAWYRANGTMQDYNYQFGGALAVTFEVSCCKHPTPKELGQLWEANKDAMLGFLLQANNGVRGQIVDAQTKEPVQGVSLNIKDRSRVHFNTTEAGEFWRLLLPGTYALQTSKAGYMDKVIEFTIEQADAPVVLNVAIEPSTMSNDLQA